VVKFLLRKKLSQKYIPTQCSNPFKGKGGAYYVWEEPKKCLSVGNRKKIPSLKSEYKVCDKCRKLYQSVLI
jgi:hypothetical protein